MEDITKMSSHELTGRIWALKFFKARDDYEGARKYAQPYLDELNKRMQAISKKYNRRHKKMTFSGFGRNIGKGVNI